MIKSSVNPTITEYIFRLPVWQQSYANRLRELIHRADPGITEELKWNAPAFLHTGLVCGLFSAKDWLHFTFYQGALIEDTYKIFNSGLNNKAGRVLLIREGDVLPEAAIVHYVRESISNNAKGKKIVFQPTPKYDIELPEDVITALLQSHLMKAYDARPYYQRKGYIQWLDQTKTEATRERRLTRMLEELRDGTYMPPRRKTGN